MLPLPEEWAEEFGERRNGKAMLLQSELDARPNGDLVACAVSMGKALGRTPISPQELALSLRGVL